MNQKLNLSAFAIFPCRKNKKIPATTNGFKDAKFACNPNTYFLKENNIGIACEISKIFVLDLDVDATKNLNGIEDIQILEKELGTLPIGFAVKTPRGGLHLYYKSKGITNPIGKIGRSCDCKYHGYVLAPGSKINGKSYIVIRGINNDGTPILPELPKNWLNYINKNTSEKKNTQIQPIEKRPSKKKIIGVNFKKMYSSCSFIKRCVDFGHCLSEPEWHLFACVLSKFRNGEELFDYYSSSYPKYDKEKTIKKFQNASKYNVTCNTIAKVYEDCQKCEIIKRRLQNGN